MSDLTPQSALKDLLESIRGAIPGDVQVYLVGGAVRDYLKKRKIHDLDFVVQARDVLVISRRVANTLGAAYYPLDTERQTARVILKSSGESQALDFAAPRGPDLESDLRGRDFTINAMAIDITAPQELVDPLHGAADLHDKNLRVCSPKSLLDDPVRILRAVRLSVDFELTMSSDTKTLIHQAMPFLATVSAERQRDELFRILDGKQPTTALRLLDHFKVLEPLLPEILELKDLQQPPPHVYNGWEHTLAVIQKLNRVLNVLAMQHDPESAANWASGLISLRLGRYREQIQAHLENNLNPDRSLRALFFLAALYHDSGKPRTFEVDDGGKMHFYGHERVSEELVELRAQQLRLSKVEIQRVKCIVRHHMRPIMLLSTGRKPSRRAVYRFFRDTGEAGVDICLLSLADTLATYGPELPQDVWLAQIDTVRALLSAYWEENEKKIAPEALISGRDLIDGFKMKPGPQIGDLLEALREAQAMGEVNDRGQARRFVHEWLDQDN
jgi:tRNA nucleotidyltransferase/poly(A) polymerase